VRVSVYDRQCLDALPEIIKGAGIPVAADIHFDYQLAIGAIERGVQKVRINPGNIGDDGKVHDVVKACKANGIPIRIGVNGGSLEKHILAKYGSPTPEALAESAAYHIALLEKFDFDDIIVSLKSSDVPTMIEAYELISQRYAYPLHLGVTEAGTRKMGVIKSAIGIGALLSHGIGDTIRVSLTDDPVLEVEAGLDILRALNLRFDKPRIISCPTCGRTQIDIITLTKQVEDALKDVKKPITVAVMGCAVNGPGEARGADIGIAGGKGEGLLIKKGQILRKVPENELLQVLLAEIETL
jgi:(E)-4-hydroxy-3-methylbut-2-enyl-diphosphate synthase